MCGCRWGDTLNLKGGGGAFVTVAKATRNGNGDSQKMRIEEAEVSIWNFGYSLTIVFMLT